MAEQAINTMLTGGRVLGQNEDEEFRISLAGAQEKIALLRHKGQWCRPRGVTPTTHIIKLPLGRIGALQMDMKDSVENEWLCLKLLAAFGLPVPDCEIVQFGTRRALAVERFDRAWQAKNRWIAGYRRRISARRWGCRAHRNTSPTAGQG